MQLHQLEGDHEALLHMPFQSSYVEQYHGRNKAEDVLQAQTTHKTFHAAHKFMNRWNPQRQQTIILSSFALAMSVAFTHNKDQM